MTLRRAETNHTRGRRAEEVASWYLRLNGFLQIPGFVLHSDEPRRPITDADILGVRFPHSEETLRGIRMTDDRWIQSVSDPRQILFVIVEVKTALCRVNGPWTNRDLGGMERVIRRIGFAPDDMAAGIADSLYNALHWKNDDFVVQYVCIGGQRNHELTTRYCNLKQLTWDEIAAFLWERFRSFGAIKGAHHGWPRFGREFATQVTQKRIQHVTGAQDFVHRYIEARKPDVRQ